MRSLLPALALFVLSFPGTATADALIYRGQPGPAERCAAQLEARETPDARLQRLCDAGTEQTDLSLEGKAAAFANAGIVRLRLGDVDGARQQLEQAREMRLAPSDIDVSLSAALIRMGEAEAALDVLSDPLSISADLRHIALLNRAIAHVETGAVEAAYIDLQNAVLMRPDYAPARDMLAQFTLAETGEISSVAP